MRRSFFMLVVVSWLVCGCYQIAANETEGSDKSPQCGDVVLEGYLVTPWTCPQMSQQGEPSITEYETEDGFNCRLDVRFSEVAIDTSDLSICSTEPVTSECFLSEIGYIESPGESVPDSRVTILGYYETATLCVRVPEGDSKTNATEVCNSEEIFIPCRVETD